MSSYEIEHEIKERLENKWSRFLRDNDKSVLSLPSEQKEFHFDFLKECLIEQAVEIALLKKEIEDISNRLGCCC